MATLSKTKRALRAALLGSMLGGCQGGYPIAATLCDDWCEVFEPAECNFTSPSSCVKQCEDGGFSRRCATQLDAAITCIEEKHSRHLPCLGYFQDDMDPCKSELNAFTNCAYSGQRE